MYIYCELWLLGILRILVNWSRYLIVSYHDVTSSLLQLVLYHFLIYRQFVLSYEINEAWSKEYRHRLQTLITYFHIEQVSWTASRARKQNECAVLVMKEQWPTAQYFLYFSQLYKVKRHIWCPGAIYLYIYKQIFIGTRLWSH